MEGLPLPVICLILERIEELTPERLGQLSSCFSNRKWLRACRDDVPWRAALCNTGGAKDFPDNGIHRWFVTEYVPLVAKAVAELHKGYTRVWAGGGLYGQAQAKLDSKEGNDLVPMQCKEGGVGGNLLPGYRGMKSMVECLHPHCRARQVHVFSCTVQQTGNYFSPEWAHSHWLECCVCRRRLFWFEEILYG